jgi:predicted glycoside hydrolase/deacetylase ChbG (UPF0249 family)
VRVVFEDESDVEILERAARALEERALIDAEGTKGTSIEEIHRESQAQYLRFADRIKAVRSRPTPEPPNVRPIRRE